MGSFLAGFCTASFLLIPTPTSLPDPSVADQDLLAVSSAPPPFRSERTLWAALRIPDPREVALEAASQGLPAVLEQMEMNYGLSPVAARHLVESWWWREGRRGFRFDPAHIAMSRRAVLEASRNLPGNLLIAAELALRVHPRFRDADANEGAALFDYLERAPDPTGLALLLAAGGWGLGPVVPGLLSFSIARDPSKIQQAMTLASPAGPNSLGNVGFALLALEVGCRTECSATPTPDLAVLAIDALLEQGLPWVAAQVFQQSPPSVRSWIVAHPNPLNDSMLGMGDPSELPIETRRPRPDVRFDLAAALLLAGSPPAAAIELESTAPHAVEEPAWQTTLPSNLARQVLAFHLHHEKPCDAFDLAVAISRCGGSRCLAWRLLAVPVLTPAYASTARAILANPNDSESTRESIARQMVLAPQLETVLSGPLKRLREGVHRQALQQEHALAGLEVPGGSAAAATEARVHATVSRLLTALADSPFTEHPMPRRSQLRPAQAISPSLPRNYRLVRAESYGRQAVAVALSQRTDPSGEVSTGAYWLFLSKDGGAHWGPALYLGLRQSQPYVIAESSDLHIVDGDYLRLEAEVRELDPRSVTFPPIALRVGRTKTGIYLEARLSDVRRDSDGDGLTDLLEERLLLDPHNADTDGDGIPDGVDDIPHVSANGTPTVPPELMMTFLERVTGKHGRPHGNIVGLPDPASSSDDVVAHSAGTPAPEEEEGVLYVEGNRADFAGLHPGVRVIVLTPQEAERARARFGIFYPMRIQIVVNAAGDRAYLTFDERWRGGSFSATKSGDTWTLTDVGWWIT